MQENIALELLFKSNNIFMTIEHIEPLLVKDNIKSQNFSNMLNI